MATSMPQRPFPQGSRPPSPQMDPGFDPNRGGPPPNFPPSATSSSDFQTPTTEPRPGPKPARVSLNGKTYEIRFKNHGTIENPNPAQAQKFATLFGITLQYGIAALKHQHKLSEQEIRLKYIKIKKKTDGKLLLYYRDKKNNKKYKIEITDDLEIALKDTKEITKYCESTYKTAFDTYDAAIKCFEAPSLGSSGNTPGIYELKIPNASDLSKKFKEIYDPNKAKTPKALESAKKKASSQPRKPSSSPRAEEEKTDKSTASRKAKSREKEDKSRDDATDGSNKKGNPTPAASSPDVTKAKSAKNAKAESADLSKEEKDISKIPLISVTDAQEDKTSWRDYLLEGILYDQASKGKLPAARKPVERSVKPQSFSHEKAWEILNKIITKQEIDETSTEEKIFLKRLVLLLKAYKTDQSIDVFTENELKTQIQFIVFNGFFTNNQDELNQFQKNLDTHITAITKFLNLELKK